MTGSERSRCAAPHPLLARDLEPRVLPEGVRERGVLGEGQPGVRLVVGGDRADEDVLAGLSGEGVHGQVHLRRRVGEEVHDRVPAARRRLVEGGRVVAVPVEDLDPGPEGRGPLPAGQEADLVAAGESVLHAGRADVPGSAEEEDPHGCAPPGPSNRSAAPPGTR